MIPCPSLQPIRVAWVDNPIVVKYKLGEALDIELDKLILDPLHAMMVVARTIADDHALKGEFDQDLTQYCLCLLVTKLRETVTLPLASTLNSFVG